MPKSKSGGRLRTSRTEPKSFQQRDQASTEVKYFGLVRDNALGDLTNNGAALSETLRDIQDPAEASSQGVFSPPDLAILDGIERFDLKKEDFEILEGASIDSENDEGTTNPLVNPRQRISDRIGQAESFAGRGTARQGQGTVLYKYYVPTDQPSGSTDKYSHTNPPPFFTEAITSTVENSADFIPVTPAQIASTHRIGYIQNGVFTPDTEQEYWWSGEYNHEFFSADEYGDPTQSALTNPKYPIVRDGNMKFDQIKPRGITSQYNWGLRFDAWFKKSDLSSNSTLMRWAVQVNGHLRIDYFDKVGYNTSTKAIEGTWRTALNTFDSSTYYTQISRENPTSTPLGARLYYVQGGPSMALGAGTGTLPTQRSVASGGALDLDKVYTKLEGITTLVVTSYTGANSTTVTANMSSTTGLNPNDVIRISGASGTEQSKLNGVWRIATVASTSFTFVVDSSVASGTYTSNTGTIIKSTSFASNFDDDYVPVVIRFWYGQPSTNSLNTDITTSRPGGPAGFYLQTIETNLSRSSLSKWNDYSSQLRLTWNSTQSAWVVDTTSGGSASGEANFANFNQNFEIIAYTSIGASKPTALTGYTIPSTVIIASETEVSGTVYASFTIPGISPTNGQSLWVIAKNRPYNVIPESATRNEDSLWQRHLFNPNPTGRYKKATDLLDGVGANYAEPDPSRVPFNENLEFYKIMNGNLPQIDTYGADRYDGTILNSVTESNTERDYDYNHSKVLMVGRQKKGTISEIGTTSPYSGRDLAAGEVRKKGENYTFIEVVENQAGFGGSITINAYPSNDMGVINTTSTTTYGKTLHMLDNVTTFSKSDRQNISTIVNDNLPTTANFSSTARILYEEVNGQGRFSYGTWNGTTFTYDNTGVIAQLTMGATTQDHDVKSAFITSFRKGSTDYNFYGLIGVQRTSFEGVSLTVNSGGTTITSSGGVFSAGADTSNNNQFIGSQIYFSGDTQVRTVTSYNASTGVVTFTPSKTAGTYTCDVWYNHLQMGSTLPSNITNSSGTKTSRTSIIPAPTTGNTSDRLIQIRLVYSSGYQFLRVDNGAGLSFSETLYVKAASSPTAVSPFTFDTELPAPPADIVTPFGYDNTAASTTNPGLGGLCYPPYSIQNIDLQPLAKSDASLYSSTEGEFDMWWGGRIGDVSTLGQKYLYVTDKLIFDFAASERSNLLSQLGTSDKPLFAGSEYTHKLEVELNVGLPSNSSTATNANIYNDARFHSNNKPVKDKYYLFINKQTGGNELRVLSANNPSWT